MGTIDVDPASCDFAQQMVQATIYYTLEDDGLQHPWDGNVHLNPPYSDPEPHVGKLIAELEAGRTKQAILLVNNCSETQWYARVATYAQLICTPTGRIKFVSPTREETSGTAQGQAVFYFGPQADLFAEVFSEIGHIWQLSRAKDAGPQLELAAPTPAPADPETPALPQMAPGTIGEQILAVLRGAPRGMANAAIAHAIGKERKRSFQALERLVERGTVRKEGTTYVLVGKK
jgi:hypothetical protein